MTTPTVLSLDKAGQFACRLNDLTCAIAREMDLTAEELATGAAIYAGAITRANADDGAVDAAIAQAVGIMSRFARLVSVEPLHSIQ